MNEQMIEDPLTTIPLAPPSWLQLCVVVADGSSSMTLELAEPDASLDGLTPSRTKAAAVDGALRELLNRMKVSRKAANFQFAFVTFNDRVSGERAPQDLIGIDSNESFDPTARGTGGTRIWTGLEVAERIASDFMSDAAEADVPKSAVVLVMSDGEDGEPAKTLEIAERLKAIPNTHVASCLFASKGEPTSGAQLLQAIASEPRLYATVYDAEQLRAFFHASVTATAVAAGGRPS